MDITPSLSLLTGTGDSVGIMRRSAEGFDVRALEFVPVEALTCKYTTVAMMKKKGLFIMSHTESCGSLLLGAYHDWTSLQLLG